ncbi:MAG: hypothetical protein E7510_12525 [Ruminococcus sp.]|jgi:hypothetical protein|nr:hypothetical protein [Ruminococcus sp.]MBP1565436.1 hypothetical protein [Oscillospiraceae bacterium]
MPDETTISVTETELSEIIVTEPEATTAPEDSTTLETTTTVTDSPALEQSVKNIETMMFYNLGITIVIITCLLCRYIIKTFFG